MADVLKLLADSAGVRTPAAATPTTLYTVPASTSTMVTRVIICNTSSVPTFFRIAVIEPGTALGSLSFDHYLAYDMPIGGNETINFALGLGLAATSLLVVYNTLATLTFTACGIEVTV